MKKFALSVFALALAVLALVPGICSARLAANHNRTLLCG